jgi:hypothetical protein
MTADAVIVEDGLYVCRKTHLAIAAAERGAEHRNT